MSSSVSSLCGCCFISRFISHFILPRSDWGQLLSWKPAESFSQNQPGKGNVAEDEVLGSERGTEAGKTTAADDHLHHRREIHYVAKMFNLLTRKIRMECFPSNHCALINLPDLRCIFVATQLEMYLLQVQHSIRLFSPHLSHLCTFLFHPLRARDPFVPCFLHSTFLCCIFNRNILLDLQCYAINPWIID